MPERPHALPLPLRAPVDTDAEVVVGVDSMRPVLRKPRENR